TKQQINRCRGSGVDGPPVGKRTTHVDEADVWKLNRPTTIVSTRTITTIGTIKLDVGTVEWVTS
ncbi:hypothetical protein Bpfe_002964, partial [Biomphalaria pfeifferi]